RLLLLTRASHTMDVRIIGICPVIKQFDENGDLKEGVKPLFWLYFPECRYVFQNYFVYNRQNDAQRMSFDDLFWKRMFASFIHKESNVYDRDVKIYEQNGIKALLQSEKIKNEMLLIEHDLWHL
ncbi:MAG: gliding motility protein GldN, partial [Flavobacteriales bacterium]